MRLPSHFHSILVCLVFAIAAGALRADTAAPPPVYRLGALTDNYPFSFQHPDGTMDGFAYELLTEIESVMGLRFERVVGRTREVQDKFRAREIDIMQVYARFPEREREAEFSFPYLTMAGALFVRADDKSIQSLEDCRGKKVAVHRGSQGEAVLRRMQLGDSVYHVDSIEDAILGVSKGEVDATLLSRLSGMALAHHTNVKNLRVVDTGVPGYIVNYCIGVQKGNHELLAKLN